MAEPTIDERVRELRKQEAIYTAVLAARDSGVASRENWAIAKEFYGALCAKHIPAILDALAEAQRRVAALEGDMNPQDVQEAYAREGIE